MSTKYIHFTEEQKERASQTDLVALLLSQGEKLKHSGSEYEWLDGSQKVTIRGNLWYHQYEQKGGNAIDFVRRFYNKSYPEAIEYLLGNCNGTLSVSSTLPREPKQFILPKKNENMRRVYAYLLSCRCIDRDVLYTFVNKGLIYESHPHHNAVFVGIDKKGKPCHAHKRSTASQGTYKGNAVGSMPEYSFHWAGTDDVLYLFEAPIDMLSFISMHKANWQQHSYAACCGVGDQVLFQMLQDNPNIKMVYLCLDNDEAGQTANKRIADKLFVKGITHEVLIPTRKDWNEDLLYIQKQEAQKCQVSQLSLS